MKKFLAIFMAALFMIGCIGCGKEEDVVESVPEDITTDITDVDEEVFLGQRLSNGMIPSGLVAIYLDGDDAYDRLGDFSVALGDMYTDLINNQGVGLKYEYKGIGATDTGAVLSIYLENTKLYLGKSKSLTEELERIEALTGENGFNKGECRIEYDLAKPPFKNSESVMRNMFNDSRIGDGICILASFGEDKHLLPEETAANIKNTMANRYGYSVNDITLSADDYRMCSNTQKADFLCAIGIDSAYTSLEKAVPYFLTCLQENTCCEGVDNATEDMAAWDDEIDFFSRSSRTLSSIFGTNLLNNICAVGCAEAEKSLDLGTDYIIQSNWGLVYTDVQGNFRVRLALMVKNPAGKTGWHIGAYEVLVKTAEGDMFTSTNYVATGEIITVVPLVSLETSVAHGEARVISENGKKIALNEGEYGITTNEICHAFFVNGKIDQISELHPGWLLTHNETCKNVYCNMTF